MADTDFDTSYAQVMEHINVTPEMRERVLAGVAAALEEESAPEVEESTVEEPTAERKGLRLFSGGRSRTRWFAVAACLLVALVAGVTLLNRPAVEGDTEKNPGVALTAPEEFGSRGELSEAVGVPVPEVPYLDDKAVSVEYVSLWGEIAEVRYQLSDGSADLRVSHEPGDNSGDYNEYAVEETFEYSGATVTLKGNDGGYQLALWDQDGYGVSLRFDDPVARDTLVTCAESVIDAL